MPDLLSNDYFGLHVHLGRGRVRHHNRQLADRRHKEDAGNGQRVERVRWYFENGTEAGKGWGNAAAGQSHTP